MGQRRRARLPAVLAVAAVLVAGLVGWRLLGRSDPAPWHKPATVDGAVVTVSYTGSECRAGAEAEVEQDGARVVVTVLERVRAGSCSDVGVTYVVEVELDAPLGDRELVDGACLKEEYAGYPDCRPGLVTVRR